MPEVEEVLLGAELGHDVRGRRALPHGPGPGVQLREHGVERRLRVFQVPVRVQQVVTSRKPRGGTVLDRTAVRLAGLPLD